MKELQQNVNNSSNQLKKYSVKDALKLVFKNWFFIYFSFVNMFIPFYATIISSLLAPHATINLTCVGLTTSFISIFNQFLFLIALTMVFVLNKNIMTATSLEVDRKTISLIMLIYSSVSTLLFIGCSLLYIRFSTLYVGYTQTFNYALEFVLMVAPTFIINGFVYLNIIYKLETNKWKSFLTYSIYFALNLILIPVFYLFIPFTVEWQLIGMGLGFLVASLITFLFVFLFNMKSKEFMDEFHLTFNKESLKMFFSKTSNFISTFLLSTIMKGFLVMTIGLSLNLSSKPTFTSLMVAKIIWYNCLFFCGFFGDGVLYSIEYSKMKSQLLNNGNYQASLKTMFSFAGIVWLGTFIVCVLFSATAKHGLSYLYAQNQEAPIGGEVTDNFHWLLFVPHQEEIGNFLWSTQKVNLQMITGALTPCYALMYLTIFHTTMNSVKILTSKKLVMDQKFNWKGLLTNILMLAIVMTIIAVLGCAFNEPKYANYLNTFNGLDAFSFGLTMISVFMMTMVLSGMAIKISKMKKMMKKNSVTQTSV